MNGAAGLLGVLVLLLTAAAFAQNVGFVSTQGRHFMVQNRPAFFVGTNNYYQMLHRRSGRSADADEVLDKMAARSMNLLRTWAFQDMAEYSPQCLLCAPVRQLQGGEKPLDFLNENTFRGLDQTLAAADARGIRVILALVNNWGDYGGMDRWTLWRFGSVNHDAFYTDAAIKEWYRQLAAVLINRVNTVNGRLYRDDPTIFAWELANEPRGSSPTALNNWIGEMSVYIKSLDPNHLVTTGIEGFYSGPYAARNLESWMSSNGQDFISNHLHAGIDFATCHVYPENWGWNPRGNPAYARQRSALYIQQHIDDADAILNKPLLLEEFGAPRDNGGRGINGGPTVIRDQFYSEVFHPLIAESALNGGAGAGTAMWILFDDATANYDDGNGVFLPHDHSTDAIITAHARFMRKLRRGDLDFDDDVDQSDYGRLQACLSGNGWPVSAPACHNADMDGDGDVDAGDVTLFRKCQTGANNPDDPDCVY
ncbi:MAG: cellulase family glycosylhydrolase [Phycisphaerae bacterium]|jgi:mannan endo-1,4-beta-mannosidase